MSQVIGKDITWFHTVIWPTMLMSAGIPRPERVFAHGFVNDEEGRKMSKSVGNVIPPHPVIDEVGADAFRLYFMHSTPMGNDLPFMKTALLSTYNSVIVKNIGNGCNRFLKMCSM